MKLSKVCLWCACLGLGLAVVPKDAKAIDSFFDVFFDVTVNDVDPAGGTDVGTMGTMTGGAYEPLAGLVVSMTTSQPNTGLRVVGGEPVPGSNFFVDSFFDVFYDLQADPTGDQFHVDSFFDVFVELHAPQSDKPAPVARVLGGNFQVDSFFDILYEIDFQDGRTAKMTLHGQAAPGLKITRVGSNNSPEFNVDSFFDVFCDLTVDDSGTLDLTKPLLIMDLSGQGTPEPASLSLLALGGLALARRRR